MWTPITDETVYDYLNRIYKPTLALIDDEASRPEDGALRKHIDKMISESKLCVKDNQVHRNDTPTHKS